ncbi:MAG: sulfur carrier protein ThiS [Bacteroidales bacterium]
MKVFLNHQEIFVGSRVTLRDLLAGQSITPEGVAVAVNNRVIVKDEWHDTMLADGDKVTVISASTVG